jgi:hypothetical protein
LLPPYSRRLDTHPARTSRSTSLVPLFSRDFTHPAQSFRSTSL